MKDLPRYTFEDIVTICEGYIKGDPKYDHINIPEAFLAICDKLKSIEEKLSSKSTISENK